MQEDEENDVLEAAKVSGSQEKLSRGDAQARTKVRKFRHRSLRCFFFFERVSEMKLLVVKPKAFTFFRLLFLSLPPFAALERRLLLFCSTSLSTGCKALCCRKPLVEKEKQQKQRSLCCSEAKERRILFSLSLSINQEPRWPTRTSSAAAMDW